jgi:diguanylate cyclase (GGDEF)-like protein
MPGQGQAQQAESTVRDAFQILSYRHRYEDARDQMTRDALTGLFNRGYFEEYMPKQLAHANRNREPTSLALIDADNLKMDNDQFGHPAGDRLIRLVADALREFVRQSDTACRYGGDEFVVVLTSADGKAARIFADRFLERVIQRAKNDNLPFPWERATVTIGIATCPVEAATPVELVALADQRLYEGKRAGGARVTGGTLTEPERPADVAAL